MRSLELESPTLVQPLGSENTGLNTAAVTSADNMIPGRPATGDVLSARDLKFKSDRELIVTEGVKGSITAARALHEIHAYRDGILYQEYPSFASYCMARWGFQKSHAYRLAEYGDFVLALEDSPIGEKLPTNENQIRPLLSLPRASRVPCWTEIIATNPVETITGRVVAQRAREYAEAHGIETTKSTKAPRAGAEQAVAAPTALRAAVAAEVVAAPGSVAPPQKSRVQILDDEIRALLQRLESLTVNHRNAVLWADPIEACFGLLES